MSIGCVLDVYWIGCVLNVPLDVYWMSIGCVLDVHWMCTVHPNPNAYYRYYRMIIWIIHKKNPYHRICTVDNCIGAAAGNSSIIARSNQIRRLLV